MQAARNLLLLISLLVSVHCNLGFREPLAISLSRHNRLIHMPDLENLSITLAQAHIGSKLYGNEIRAQFVEYANPVLDESWPRI
jgi:hypothetical protein